MSGFSGAVTINDLDDFIAPSQACVKPMFKNYTNSGQNDKDKRLKRGVIELHETFEETSSLVPTPTITETEVKATAKISLTDCLACSGCITTAESVLVSEQSTIEFLKALSQKEKKKFVVSISPQARASFAVDWQISLLEAHNRLTSYFLDLGCDLITDTSIATDISIIETRNEFLYRWQNSGPFPLLTSSCPGWICYAEKSVGKIVLPLISKCKSPQQIMGTLIKKYWANDLELRPDEVYHTTIMPCFDKKLEASRPDFFCDEKETREVDLVLSTKEIKEMIEKQNPTFEFSEEKENDNSFTNIDENGEKLYGISGGSGGALEYVFDFATIQLFGGNGVKKEIIGRNKDMKEIIYEVDGKVVLRFAMVYGFRNLQTLIRKIKNKTCVYHFVEIMACPSGCTNGGAQIRTGDFHKDKEIAIKVDQAYHSRDIRDPIDNTKVKNIYEKWLYSTNPNENNVTTTPHPSFTTQYHEIEKLQSGLTEKW